MAWMPCNNSGNANGTQAYGPFAPANAGMNMHNAAEDNSPADRGIRRRQSMQKEILKRRADTGLRPGRLPQVLWKTAAVIAE